MGKQDCLKIVGVRNKVNMEINPESNLVEFVSSPNRMVNVFGSSFTFFQFFFEGRLSLPPKFR